MDPKKLVQELKQEGFSENEISRYTGVSQPTINRIRRGISHGSLRVAIKIQDAHGRLCSKENRDDSTH